MLFRIYLPELSKDLNLSDEDHHYLANSLRLRDGQEFEVVNGQGQVGVYTLAGEQATQVKIYAENNEPQRKLVLVQPLLKADKLEYVLQKVTELGVQEIRIYAADTSPVELKNAGTKLDRWQKIIRSSVCQSRRSHFPELQVFPSLAKALNGLSTIYAADFPATLKISEVSSDGALVIGPESGFSSAEKALLAQKAKIISLGSTVLRTETASVAGCARILL